jgi:hypothetical protein
MIRSDQTDQLSTTRATGITKTLVAQVATTVSPARTHRAVTFALSPVAWTIRLPTTNVRLPTTQLITKSKV